MDGVLSRLGNGVGRVITHSGTPLVGTSGEAVSQLTLVDPVTDSASPRPLS